MLKAIWLIPSILILYYCAKMPKAPIHTKMSGLLSQECGALGLTTSTDETTEIELIVPVALDKLTLSDVVAQGQEPFPPLKLQFLALSANINDTKGGYAHFVVTSDTQKTYTTDVPSGLVHWIPNLPVGTYKVTAVPCNSLGCREDLLQTLPYLQAPNNTASLSAVTTAFNQCYSLYGKLQATGAKIVSQAKSVEAYFNSMVGLSLDEGNRSCIDNALQRAGNGMQNIQTLGPSYMSDMMINPDIIGKQIDLYHENQSSSSTQTVTVTTASPSPSSSNDSTAKYILLGFGVPAIAVGALLFLSNVGSASKGWTAIWNSNEVTADKIFRQLSADYTFAEANKAAAKITDAEIKPIVERKIQKKKDGTWGTGANGDSFDYKASEYLSYQNKMKTSFIKATGGGLAAIAGVIMVAIGASLNLDSGTTDTSTDTGNAFDTAANYINNTVLPLQEQYNQCMVTLAQAIEDASK